MFQELTPILPDHTVVPYPRGSTQCIAAYLDRNPFDVAIQVCLGPRGGVSGHALLLDRRITPATDAIQVAALDDISRDPFCPLGRICWSDDTKLAPTPSDIAALLRECLQTIPTEIALLEQRFRDKMIKCPANSVSALSGGAPGLRK